MTRSTIGSSKLFASSLLLLALAACGGGGSDSGGSAPASTYTVGGTVTGLTGTGLTLLNSGGNSLSVSASGSFAFTTALANGAAYAVTVGTQPSGQTCTIANGSGTVASANVTNVAVNCVSNSTPTFTIGGTVSGLTGSLVLRNNGGNDLTVQASATSFAFPAGLASGATYAVTVQTQPSGQTCAVAAGSGTVGVVNVTNVAVTCTTNVTPTFTIGGTVTGLTGSGLVLLNNGGNSLSVPAAGSFTFSTALATGVAYAVTVGTQPSGQTCTVAGGSGTVAGANVGNVAVTCVITPPGTHTIGGSISGLTVSGLVLRNNGGNDLSVPANATSFTFSTPIAVGATYAVTVQTQPSGWACSVTSGTGSGTVGGTNVTSVAVTCAVIPPSTHTVGGTVTGLTGTGLVLRDNGGDDKTISANGAFTFATALNVAATYAVTVRTQPGSPAQTCTVTNGTGTISTTDVTNVTVTCKTRFAYVTNHDDHTIQAFVVDPATGALSAVAGVAASTTSNPTSITFDVAGKFLYVTQAPGGGTGSVLAYSVNASTGALTPISGSPFAADVDPQSIAFSPNGQFAYVSNKGDGTTNSVVNAYSVNATTGALTELTTGVNGGSPYTTDPAPTQAVVHPSGNFLYVVDHDNSLVLNYSIAPDGTLAYFSSGHGQASFGPQAMAFTPDGHFAYVARAQGTGRIDGYSIDGAGAFTQVGPFDVAAGANLSSIAVAPGGDELSVLDRTNETVTDYGINPSTGNLVVRGSGALPTDSADGTLGANPSYVTFDRIGQYVYVVNYGHNNVAVFKVDSSDGHLSEVSGSPFAVPSSGTPSPNGIAFTP